MVKNYFISGNLFIPAIIAALIFNDLHFIPGHREAEIIILFMIVAKFVIGHRVAFAIPRSLHEYVFLIFILYMSINVLMSNIVNNVSLHWLLYFLMFLPLIAESKNTLYWSLHRRKKIINLVVNFLLVSIMFGFVSRFIDFSSSPITITMLLVPISAFLPFAIFNVKYGSQKQRTMAYVVLISCLFQIMLESSRGALVIYLVSVLIGFWAIGLSKKSIKDFLLLSPLIVIALTGLALNIDIVTIFSDTLLIFGGTVEDTGALKDIDRILNYVAMIEFFQQSSLSTIFFGTGFRSAWLYVGESLSYLYDTFLPYLDYSKDQTIIGIPGIIINIGVFGMMLICIMFTTSIFSASQGLPYRWKIFIAISILGILARNFGNDLTTNVLFIMAAMPFGIYSLLASCIRDIESKKIDN